MRINRFGYIERKTVRKVGGSKKTDMHTNYRDWYLVKSSGSAGWVSLTTVYLPKNLIGKRVRFKREIIEDKK